MKKYNNFIIENIYDYNEIITLIEKECKYFLENDAILLYRGFKEDIENYKLLERRHNRKSVDMPINVHAKLDELFEKEFGWKVRSSGIFATTSIVDAKSYMKRKKGDDGFMYREKPYIFIPKGKYKYVFNPDIDDLYDFLYDLYDNNSIYSIIYGYKQDELNSARDVEVVFDCDEYYLFNIKYIDIIEKLFMKK